MLRMIVMILATTATVSAPAASEWVLPLFSPDGGRPEYRVQTVPTASVSALAFDAAGKRLFAAQGTLVRVWDLAAASCGEPLAHPEITEPIRAMDLSSDGKRLAVASGKPATLVVFPTTPGEPPAVRKDLGSEINALSFSKEGAFLAAAFLDGSTRVWNAADLSPIPLPDAPAGPPPGSITDIAFSPDGRFLATTATDGAIRLREVGSWKALPPIGSGSPAAALVFTDDKGAGMAILSGRSGEGTRLVLRSREAPAAKAASKDQPAADTPPYATVTRTIPTGGGLPLDVVCLSDQRRLIVAGSAPSLRALNADNGGTIATLIGHGSAPFAVAASRELARVASGDAEGLIMLWDANSGARLATLIAPQESSDDWLILTDRGPATGPGLPRAQRSGNKTPLAADDSGVKAILIAPPTNPAPKAKAKAKNAGARPKDAK